MDVALQTGKSRSWPVRWPVDEVGGGAGQAAQTRTLLHAAYLHLHRSANAFGSPGAMTRCPSTLSGKYGACFCRSSFASVAALPIAGWRGERGQRACRPVGDASMSTGYTSKGWVSAG